MNSKPVFPLLDGAARKLSAVRRQAARSHPLAFGRLYLPHYFTLSLSRLHEELGDQLVEATRKRGARIAVAAPRGHAKSTIVSLTYILWSICYRHEEYIMLVSDTTTQAIDFFSFVKKELESNTSLQMDFSDVCEPPSSRPGPPRWRNDEVITRNSVKVTSLGAGKKIRGRRHNEHRPTLVILDDVENEELVDSPERREKMRNWFDKALLKVGADRTNVIVVGTIMHYDSLLASLIGSPAWQGKKYQAVTSWSPHPELWERWEQIYNGLESHNEEAGSDAARMFFQEQKDAMLEKTAVLWPEREDYYALMVQRVAEGPASFDSEKQNEPINPKDCLFQESDFVYWDEQWNSEEELIASLGMNGYRVGACDPSLGKAGKRRDDSAMISIIRDTKTGIMYVLDADIARRKPDEIIEAVLGYCQHRNYAKFGFETNQFQEFLADEVRRRGNANGVYPPIHDIQHTTDKVGRIQSLQPLIKQGALRFSKKHRTLLDQLRYFPKAAHDDGPDALEMAVAMAKQTLPSPEMIKTFGEYEVCKSPLFRDKKFDIWNMKW